MYKSEKVLFDKVFYGLVPFWFKVFFYCFLLGVFLTYLNLIIKYEPKTIMFVFLISAFSFLIFYVFCFMKSYRVVFGISDKGIYSWVDGWIKWGDIKDAQIREIGSKKNKYKCIVFKIKKPSSFSFVRKLRFYLNYFSVTNIPVVCERDIDMPIEDMLNVANGYLKKYGEKR